MSLTSGKQDIFPVGHSCCGRGVISDLVNLLHVDNINSGKGLSGLRSNQTFFVHSISLKKWLIFASQVCQLNNHYFRSVLWNPLVDFKKVITTMVE